MPRSTARSPARTTAERVRENRRRAADALGLPAARPARAFAGARHRGGGGGRGGWDEGAGPAADAMVTRRPGVALGIVTGDCAPVLFADAEAGVVGRRPCRLARRCWRACWKRRSRRWSGSARPARRMVAAIGPCIAQASYEVGPDLRDAVLARNAEDARFFAEGRREDRWQFDLAGYCAARLRALGLGAVEDMATDTLADEARFFSHRRRTLAGGGPLGHQLSAIALAA